jgi:hypothetical protein
MGFLSATLSMSRYRVMDRFDAEPMESVRNGLIRHAIPKIENEYEEISAGWTPYESPYLPDFEKKSIPAKLVHKQMALEMEKKKAETGRDFLSKNEKSELKETVMDVLMHKMPFIPNVYDVLWDYEAGDLFLLSTQKAANEFFETLFFKSFNLKPVRLFPYTLAETGSAFSAAHKDRIMTLTPLHFSR